MNTITETRQNQKERAKETLRGRYWYSFGVGILFCVISSLISTLSTLVGNVEESISFLAVIILAIFVTFPLSVGFRRYFIRIAQGYAPQVNDIFYPFKNGFMNTVLVGLTESVFVALWSLLFVIPGIIKTFQYFMIDNMLAENPNLSRQRAFEITKAAMRGNKGKAFIFGLSFIGWILLSIITFGIGALFLMPYMQTAYSHFYLDIKQKAIENGIIMPGELDDTIIKQQ